MGPAWGSGTIAGWALCPQTPAGKSSQEIGLPMGKSPSPETLKRSNPNKAALSLEEIPSAQRPSTREEQGGFVISVPGSDV